MPWTTGDVSVMDMELGTMGSAQTGTLTARGGDSRTKAGKGQITLVAGGTAHQVNAGLDFNNMEVVTLNFSDGSPAPSMGPLGLGAVTALMALTAGYAIRGRFAATKS